MIYAYKFLLRPTTRQFTHFLTTSGSRHVANPRTLDQAVEELAEAQRHLSAFPRRTKQRTTRHRAAARHVAKRHAKS